MAAQDVSEGDGWSQTGLPASYVIEAARRGDAQEIVRLVAAGAPLGQALWFATRQTTTISIDSLKFLLEVCGSAGVNSCSSTGWTPLASAVLNCENRWRRPDLRIIELLLSKGANPNQRIVTAHFIDTPLQLMHRPNYSALTRRLVSHLLLRYGAEISPATTDPYLCKVAAAGGLRAYEKAHRRALATTLTRVVFPRLPVDVVSHVVAFSFHTGYY